MKEGGVKESGLTRVRDIKRPASENVTLRRRIEVLEESLSEFREKVYSLESEIKRVREQIG